MESKIGPEAKLKAEMVDGKIKLSIDYDGKQLDSGVYIATDSDLLVDALLDLIPGDSAFEKSMGGLLKVALKSLSI